MIDDDLIEQLMAQVDADGVELLGPDGVLTELTKRIMERALDVERSDHLGYERGDPGCLSINGLSPPPTARRRAGGSIPAATSASALITVLRLIPDADATALLPPRPNISAAAPATTRRCTSSMWGSTTSKNRASASDVTSTPARYYALTNLARTLTHYAATSPRGVVDQPLDAMVVGVIGASSGISDVGGVSVAAGASVPIKSLTASKSAST